jgi:hypothetical protein
MFTDIYIRLPLSEKMPSAGVSNCTGKNLVFSLGFRPAEKPLAAKGGAQLTAEKAGKGKWRLLLPGASEPRLTVLPART